MPKKTALTKVKKRGFPAFSTVWKWTRRTVGVGIGAVGLSGIPGDLETWQRWINTAMYDPRVTQIAEFVVSIAEYVNLWWVRGLLILLAISILFWRWRPFWRLRHKIKFRWRKAMSEKVWISEEDAIDVLKNSDWGKLQEPNVTETFSVLDFSRLGTSTRTVHGMSDTAKALLKFDLFLKSTLRQFAETNPNSFNAESEQYDEVALRKFTRRAAENIVSSEFGDPPTIVVE